ncbi:MAG: 2Fe-2S iron-sulfur cluster-binding protein [Mycobacteriaceae bacterium]
MAVMTRCALVVFALPLTGAHVDIAWGNWGCASTPCAEIRMTAGGSVLGCCSRRTGATIRIAAGQSILDAFRDAGIEIATSCREGTCTSCETAVLDGHVIHRDSVLSEHERQQSASMMVCVSGAKSGMVVLDL